MKAIELAKQLGTENVTRKYIRTNNILFLTRVLTQFTTIFCLFVGFFLNYF